MEVEFAAFVLTICSAFCMASLMAAVMLLWVRKLRWERSYARNAWDEEAFLARVVRNGIRPLLPFSRKLCSYKAIKGYASRSARVLASRGMVASAESVLSLILCGFLVCLVLGSLASRSLVLGLASSSCLVLVAGFWSKHQEERIADSFKEDIPEALRTMQACFSVGHSLEQTFDAVAQRDAGPLSSLFAQSAGILKSGGTVQESLDCLKRDSGNSELSFLATALEIQHRTGSSMQQVLEVAREAIESDLEMTRHLRTQTAQARLSARIVTVMPFALVALFSLISEGFLSPFFESLPGMVMLVCALGMQLTGVLLVRRMLNVEVS